MKLTVLPILAMLVCPLTSQADDKWTQLDTGLLIAAEAIILVDMSQTLQFRRAGVNETNRALGSEPHRDKTIAFISASMILTAVVAVALPAGVREMFLVSVIVIDGAAVNSNRGCGCQIGYKF
jgi:hypothetical protein